MGKVGCEMSFELYVNFENNTERKINVAINSIGFSSKKEIIFFKFKFEKGLHRMGVSFLHNKVTLEPGSSLFRFPFKIKCIKPFNRDDFEGCKYVPMVFKIKYSVSPRFQEKSCEIELKDFFEKINQIIDREKTPAWQVEKPRPWQYRNPMQEK